MKVVLASAFRESSAAYIARYFTQAMSLRDTLAPRHSLRLRLVEGDSQNDTRGMLQKSAALRHFDLDLGTCNHGGPWFGSTEAPERMAALSKVGDVMMDGILSSDDVVVYVESDLVWTAATLARLIGQVSEGRDIIAPLVMAGPSFYDIWGYRADGVRFSPFPPYHHRLRLDDLTEVDSVGSCFAMAAAVPLSGVRFGTGALVEFCANARTAGFRIFVDARERISHP